MKKSLVSTVLTILMMITLIGSGHAAQTSQEPVTLKWVGAGFEASGIAAGMIERYKVTTPHVTIEYQELGSVMDTDTLSKIDTMIASGEQVDIVYLTTAALLNRALNGAALPLNDAIAACGDDFEGFYGAYAKTLAIGGNYYGIPRAGNTFKVFYNKTLADANGITVPVVTTMGQFREIAKQFASIDGLNYGGEIQSLWVQMVYGSAQVAGWKMLTEADDGSISVNFYDPRFLSSVDFYKVMALEDKSIATVANYSAETLSRRADLANQTTAFIIDGPFTYYWLNANFLFNEIGVKEMPFEIGVSELPALSEADMTAASYSTLAGGFYVPKTSANVLEAYKFERFFCDGNYDLSGNYMPMAAEADFSAAAIALTKWTTADGTVYEDIYPTDTIISSVTVPNDSFEAVFPQTEKELEYAGKYIPSIDTMLEEVFPLYLNGEIDADEFIKELTEQAQQIIEDIG
jgi:ABC-type glycerol-3-phosphate transport system substrate-binding protein